MQVYVEQDYITMEDIYDEISNIIKKNNLIKSSILCKYIVDRVLNNITLCYTFEEYYYMAIQYTILNSIMKMYDNINKIQNKIYSNLTIKITLRKYINERLYRYPDGLRLKELKNNFEILSNY